MELLSVALTYLLFVTAYADQTSTKNNAQYDSTIETDKLTGKRWAQLTNFFQQTPDSKGVVSPPSERSSGAPDRFDLESTIKNFVGYEAVQSALINALKPKPIVDTAEQSEKDAPNDGSNTQFLGDLIVRGTESLSRAINTVIAVPKNMLIKISKSTTDALNQLGAYIVGI